MRPKLSPPHSLSVIRYASLTDRAERAGRAWRTTISWNSGILSRWRAGGLGNRPTCFVALLTLGVPAFERTQEEGVRVDAHGGHIRVCVQGAVAEDELVVDGVQTPLALLDHLRSGAVELCPEGGAGCVAHCEQGRDSHRLGG